MHADAHRADYAAFLLRMWREDRDGLHLWRAVLQDAQTREEQYFVDLAALVDYLRAEFSETGSGPAANPDGRRSVSNDG
jgi:hypothetical protein